MAVPPGAVPAPARGLGSNSNYFLYSECKSVTGLSITIEITKDIISDIGFGFQLNAYSPIGANCVWQQYGLAMETADNSPLQLNVFVDNWPSPSFLQSQKLPAGSDLINYRRPLLNLPGATLPAGYKITIALKYDKDDNVTGVTFTVVDNKGKPTSTDIMLESLTVKRATPPRPVSSADLAPINSFVLNVVGPVNGKHSYLSGGAGTIIYTASSPLTVSSEDPQCTTDEKTFTSETANSVYAALLAGPSQTITQAFDIEIPSAYAPGIAFAVSQQFGLDQTDLFAVDSRGQLAVFSARGEGHWQSSKSKGPVGFARPGAALAASAHFGVDKQTDVFLVDQNSQLNVFSAVGPGDWQGPKAIGEKSFVPSNARPAASQHFGVKDQTDLFIIDKDLQLNVFWAVGSGDWQGPKTIGPKGLAHSNAVVLATQHFGVDNQTDVFVIDMNGQLNVFSAVGSGDWSGPKTIGPTGLAAQTAALAVTQRFGTNNQTDVFLVDKKGQLNVFSAVGSGDWSGPKTIGPASLAPSGAALAATQGFGTSNQTDVFLVDKHGQLNVFSVSNGGQWSDPVTISPSASAPAGADVVASPQFGVANQTDLFFISGTGSTGQGWPTVLWDKGSDQWKGPKALVNEI